MVYLKKQKKQKKHVFYTNKTFRELGSLFKTFFHNGKKVQIVNKKVQIVNITILILLSA